MGGSCGWLRQGLLTRQGYSSWVGKPCHGLLLLGCEGGQAFPLVLGHMWSISFC